MLKQKRREEMNMFESMNNARRESSLTMKIVADKDQMQNDFEQILDRE
jgi:hypothetical protein